MSKSKSKAHIFIARIGKGLAPILAAAVFLAAGALPTASAQTGSASTTRVCRPPQSGKTQFQEINEEIERTITRIDPSRKFWVDSDDEVTAVRKTAGETKTQTYSYGSRSDDGEQTVRYSFSEETRRYGISHNSKGNPNIIVEPARGDETDFITLPQKRKAPDGDEDAIEIDEADIYDVEHEISDLDLIETTPIVTPPKPPATGSRPRQSPPPIPADAKARSKQGEAAGKPDETKQISKSAKNKSPGAPPKQKEVPDWAKGKITPLEHGDPRFKRGETVRVEANYKVPPVDNLPIKAIPIEFDPITKKPTKYMEQAVLSPRSAKDAYFTGPRSANLQPILPPPGYKLTMPELKAPKPFPAKLMEIPAATPDIRVAAALKKGEEAHYLTNGGLSDVFAKHPPMPKEIADASEEVQKRWIWENAQSAMKARTLERGKSVENIAGSLAFEHGKLQLATQIAENMTLDGKRILRVADWNTENLAEGIIEMEFVRGPSIKEVRVDTDLYLDPGRCDQPCRQAIEKKFAKQGLPNPAKAREHIGAVEQFYRDSHNKVVRWNRDHSLSVYTNNSKDGIDLEVGLDYLHGENVRWDGKMWVMIDL